MNNYQQQKDDGQAGVLAHSVIQNEEAGVFASELNTGPIYAISSNTDRSTLLEPVSYAKIKQTEKIGRNQRFFFY